MGTFRNSTGTAMDSVYIPIAHQDSLWLNLEDGDSVMIVRYRGRSFVDSTREVWSTNDINRAFTAGAWLRAFRASDGSGNVGQYSVFIGAWKNGAFDGSRAVLVSHQYMVLSDPQYDTAFADVAVRDTVNAILDTLQTWDNTRLDVATSTRMATYTQPSGFLATTFPTGTIANTTNITAGTITTVSGNVNGSVGSLGATAKTDVSAAVWDELRSAHTTPNTFGQGCNLAAGAISSGTFGAGAITAAVIADLAFDSASFAADYYTKSLRSAHIAIVDTTTGVGRLTTNGDKTGYTLTAADKQAARDTALHYSQSGPILPNPSFEFDDSTSLDQNTTFWLEGTAGADSSHPSKNSIVGKWSLFLNGRSSVVRSDSFALGASHRYYLGGWFWQKNGGSLTLLRGGTTVATISGSGSTLRQWQWRDTTVLVATAGIHSISAGASAAALDSTYVDGIQFYALNDSLGGGATDTNAIRNMMLANGFARVRYKNAAFTNDTVNAATAPVISCTIGSQFLDTIFAYNTTTSSGIPNAIVRIENSSGGVLATVQTGSSGKIAITFDAGTYRLRPGFVNGVVWTDIVDTFVVTGAGQADTIRGTTFNPGVPSSANKVRVYYSEYGIQDQPLPGISITARLLWPPGKSIIQYPSTDSSKGLNNVPAKGLTDSTGFWFLDLLPVSTLSDTSAVYEINVKGTYQGENVSKTYKCIRPPNQTSWRLVIPPDCTR